MTGEYSIEESLVKHFLEWGKLNRFRVIHTKNIAFLTYDHRYNAEFAKEVRPTRVGPCS